MLKLRVAVVMICTLLASVSAHAAQCGGDFNTFIASMSREAQAAGISQGVISQALGGVTLDQAVLNFDRRQRGTFNKSFEQYVATRVGAGRIKTGQAMLQRHAALLSRIERQFGVPPQIIVAIWGLETDFGVNTGKFQTTRSLATLAYDCRRSDLFKAELMDALRIVERGDVAPQDLRGAWAGEIGQTQFMPSSYIKYAVDFDSNGRRDLLRSAPDVLASTANFLAGHGWQRGKDWEPGSANFAAIKEWNKSEVYAKTIASFATQLSRAP
jgi:lytic murein transglycosylase